MFIDANIPVLAGAEPCKLLLSKNIDTRKFQLFYTQGSRQFICTIDSNYYQQNGKPKGSILKYDMT